MRFGPEKCPAFACVRLYSELGRKTQMLSITHAGGDSVSESRRWEHKTNSAKTAEGNATMKICSKCNREKPTGEFYRDRTKEGGRSSYCKDCKHIVWNEWYHTELGQESVRRYKQSDKGRQVHRRANRRYGSTEKGKLARKRSDNKPNTLAYRRRYRQTPEGKAANYRAQQRHKKRHPRRARARRLITKAIEHEDIPSASTLYCFDCHGQAQEYHHPDYSKPLEVVALCRHCHLARHK